jgi:hypothetical protein
MLPKKEAHPAYVLSEAAGEPLPEPPFTAAF